MIPILFEKTETSFTTNGLGRLTDCISCIVEEERNGVYICQFSYPVTGAMFDQIQKGRIIGCTHDDSGDIQPFDIYASTEPIDGVVTFYANHISYRLSEITCAPFMASTAATALTGLVSNAYTTNDFTFTTDIVSSTQFTLGQPTSVRSALGGVEGSILDTYGGEFEFDVFDVKLYASRGSTKDYEARYGKNLTEYEDNIDYSETYNGVVPFWKGYDEDNNEISVTGSVTMSGQSHFSGRNVIVPMDLSDQFEDAPTSNELETLALSIMTNNQPWLPDRNITVTAIPQWQSDEYSLYQSIGLCDTIKVVFPLYNMSGTMKIIKTVFNVLLDKYDSFELGKLQTTLAQAVNASVEPKIQEAEAISKGAMAIAGNSAQHFWFKSTGNDTGAHIAEVDRSTFETTPQGGNLLARSNGIAVRDGLTELATFGASGIQVGKSDEKHIEVTATSFNVYDEDQSIPFSITTDNSLQSLQMTRTTSVSGTGGTYPTTTTNIYLMGTATDNRFYFGVDASGSPSIYTNYIDNPTSIYQYLTIDGVTCGIKEVETGVLQVYFSNTTNTKKYVGVRWTDNWRETRTKINDAILLTKYNRVTLVDSQGTSTTAYVYTYGKIAQLVIGAYRSNVAQRGILYVGKILDYVPITTANLIGRWQSTALVCGSVSPTGDIYLYNFHSSAISPIEAEPVYVLATYIYQ